METLKEEEIFDSEGLIKLRVEMPIFCRYYDHVLDILLYGVCPKCKGESLIDPIDTYNV